MKREYSFFYSCLQELLRDYGPARNDEKYGIRLADTWKDLLLPDCNTFSGSDNSKLLTVYS